MNYYNLTKSILGKRRCRESMVGVDPNLILIDHTDLERADIETSSGAISSIMLPLGCKGIKLCTAEGGVEAQIELVKGSYFSQWQHRITVRLFDKNQTIKEELNRLSKTRVAAIICNKGFAHNGETKYELYGAVSGLELYESGSNSANSDSTLFSFVLQSPETAGEPRLPISIFCEDLTMTDIWLNRLVRSYTHFYTSDGDVFYTNNNELIRIYE